MDRRSCLDSGLEMGLPSSWEMDPSLRASCLHFCFWPCSTPRWCPAGKHPLLRSKKRALRELADTRRVQICFQLQE